MVCIGEYGNESLDNIRQCTLSPVEKMYWALHHKTGQSVVQRPGLRKVPFDLLLPYQIIINTIEHMTVQ